MGDLKIVGCRRNEGHFLGGLSSGNAKLAFCRDPLVSNGWHTPLECPKNASILRSTGLFVWLCGVVLGVGGGGCYVDM